MSFTTPIFLFLFLPIALLLYQFVPAKLKNIYILLISIAFYGWSEWAFLPVIIIAMFINWLLAGLMSRYPKAKKIYLIFGIMTSLGILIYGKYIPFIVFNYNHICPWLGLDQLPESIISLPLGISFFTFHSLSYLIDIYLGKAKQGSLISTGVYLLFFPQVAAGPINKYQNMAPQLSSHPVDASIIGSSIARFIIGLSQKMLLANSFALLANQIFSLGQQDLSFATAWLGIIAYTLQIYFDFAGYSNMAIGIGALFGLKLTENFNLPYTASSITKFWERWHMSLTSWLREYLYFPLGGNRKGVIRTYLNIAIVFLVSGIWHGAGWHFVVWGMWHGLFMILERLGRKLKIFKFPIWKIIGHIYTILVVMIGWVFFRSNSLSISIKYLSTLFIYDNSISRNYWLNYLTPYTTSLLIVGILIAGGLNIKTPKQLSFLKILGLIVLFGLSILNVASSTYSAFIYFKF